MTGVASIAYTVVCKYVPPLYSEWITICVGVAEYIESGSGSDDVLSGMETDKCPEEALRSVFAGVHCVLTSALRLPRLKSEVS